MLQKFWPRAKRSTNSIWLRLANATIVRGCMQFLFIFAVPGPALPVYAGSASGKVSSIQLSNNSSAVLFSAGSVIDKTPRCNTLNLFAIDLKQAGGAAMYSLLLDARHYDYVISVTGLNTCSVYFEAESVKTIVLD